ncbi:MAG: DUF4197 domain-containing protein [Thermodesulfobacteriota bacterium]
MMKKTLLVSFILLISLTSCRTAGTLDELLAALPTPDSGPLSEGTIISGLKEALTVGTKNAVDRVSVKNGYFRNRAIKILIPEDVRWVTDLISKAGFSKEVDAFTLSMNRAAERAATEAASIFVNSVKQMSFADAKGILYGGETAATDYFREKTGDEIFNRFKPIVAKAVDEVGVTKSFKNMMKAYNTLPYSRAVMIDLDTYVTEGASKGLFRMLAVEEKKIRTDPAARVTALLKKVFSQ